MGTSAGRFVMGMPADNLEIVGLDGSLPVACGDGLPVARRKSDGMFCKLALRQDGVPPIWYPAAMLNNMSGISRLEAPVVLPRSVSATLVADRGAQPIVVYADESFLRQAELTLPVDADGEPCHWTGIAHRIPQAWAACLSETAGTALLNRWAEHIVAKLDTLLPQGAAHRQAISDLAHLGLCAAREPHLRWRLHLRFAAALQADRVRRTFDTFVHREFPGASWEDFCKQRQSLLDALTCRVNCAGNAEALEPMVRESGKGELDASADHSRSPIKDRMSPLSVDAAQDAPIRAVMKVTDLQQFINGLAQRMKNAGAGQKVLDDLAVMSQSLERFKERTIQEFNEFLQMAYNYIADGSLPDAGPRPSRRRPVSSKAPEISVEEAARRIMALSERAARYDIEHGMIDAEVNLLHAMTVPQLRQLAEQVLMTTPPNMRTKQHLLNALVTGIKEHKLFCERPLSMHPAGPSRSPGRAVP